MSMTTLTEPTPAIADVSAAYPLRFEPLYQYRLWGGRRLAHVLAAPLPGDEPIGEAWLLSDREDHPSVVADGPLKGQTIQQLMQRWPKQLLGKFAGRFSRFPLLLKFLDAEGALRAGASIGSNGALHPARRKRKDRSLGRARSRRE